MEQLVELLRRQLDASEKRADERAAAEAKREAIRKAEYETTTQALLAKIEALSAPRTGGGSTTPVNAASEKELIMQSLSQRIAEFVFDPDTDVMFDNWYRRVEATLTVDGASLDKRSRVRLLVSKLHMTAFTRYSNHVLPRTPWEIGFDKSVKLLTELFDKPLSLFHLRYRCLKLVKDDADDMITYTGIVNRHCEQFKLTELTIDQFKCLVFACGLQSKNDAQVRTKILQHMESKHDMTLREAGQMCVQYTKLQEDSQMIQTAGVVKAIKHQPKRSAQFKKNSSGPQAGGRGTSGSTSTTSAMKRKPPGPCWNCGDATHFNADCPSKQNKCRTCGVTGHKDGHCEQRKGRPQAKSVKQIAINWTDTTHDAERNYATVVIQGVEVRLQADNGSDATIILHEDWKKMRKPTLTPCPDAKAVNGTPLRLYGYFHTSFHCTLSPRGRTGTCYVSDAVRVMGQSWLNQAVPEHLHGLKLICASIAQSTTVPAADTASTIAALKSQFPNVFLPGLGRCTKTKAVLQLKPDATPVFRRSRPVPHAAIADVEAELDRLVDKGVLSGTNYSDWAAPVVVVKKSDGRIHLSADYSTGLNDSLHLHQDPLPIPEDIFSTLNGGRYFSQIDFSEAYLQIEMEEESKRLLTIATHRGLYNFNRPPFGVKSAPGIFQQVVDTMLAGIEGATAYLDDIIIVGKDAADHWKNLQQVFKRIAEFGFRVNLEKCNFFWTEIQYLGFIIDAQGCRPDPAKIASIVAMPSPTDVSTLRSFLGMLSYYGNFVDEMRRIRAPLDALLKKDTVWKWTPACQRAVDRAKEVLQSDLLLTHYDPTIDLVVAGDASNYGIGAVILHRFPDGSEKAIAHASRSLTAAERNYAQIEKEGLALVFAIKKFHKFLHGRRFLLQTDHKPLLAIFGNHKGIPVYTANHLQRWATMLLGYDFAIEYQKTTDFGQADALSRLIAAHPRTTTTEDVVVATSRFMTSDKELDSTTDFEDDDDSIKMDVCAILQDQIRHLPLRVKQIQEETAVDVVLKVVTQAVKTDRWPISIQGSPLWTFHNRRARLSIVNDCLMFADRVVIPKKLQKHVLRQLHAGHPGTVQMKMLARSHVYWPNIDTNIDQLVKSCPNCASVAKSLLKAPLQSWPKPTQPWDRVHADYAGPLNGRWYLVVVDAFSKWVEILESTSITTDVTINSLNKLFTSFGMPRTLITDNGTQFTSHCFIDFCRRNGIDHVRSPPFHPQSNGQAGRFVDTFKRGIAKFQGEGTPAETLQKFLFTYRSTPSTAVQGGKTPAELFLGRPLRTTMDLLNPKKEPLQGSKDAAMESQYNRHHGARRRHFAIEDLVHARDYSTPAKPNWTPGRIVKRTGRVTFVIDADGISLTRHANQLRLRLEPDASPNDLDDLFDAFDLMPPSINPPPTRQEQQDITPLPIDDRRPPQQTEVRRPPTLTDARQPSPPRRSTRTRREPKRLDVDPRRPLYL
uniref:RNA-directed DNA polymerase n=1 Tax=Plectus sambesii TaxID=2011161 RepID=A0A914XSI1_9BILA